MQPYHAYRSVIVTLETDEHTFKFRIVGINPFVDINDSLFRIYVYRWINKRYVRYLKNINGFISNIVRITIEEEMKVGNKNDAMG